MYLKYDLQFLKYLHQCVLYGHSQSKKLPAEDYYAEISGVYGSQATQAQPIGAKIDLKNSPIARYRQGL